MSERVILNEPMSYSSYQEHVNRYAFIKNLVRSKIALDLACGSGYGTRFFASEAKTVIGCDLSSSALTFANRTYKRLNLLWVRAGATHLPFRDWCFELIASFETIEHLNEGDQPIFLEEINRVLRNGGYFICSTPRNEVVRRQHREKSSPYHVHELRVAEFKQLVEQRFKVVTYYGQGIIIPSTSVLSAKIKHIVGNLLGRRLRAKAKGLLNRTVKTHPYKSANDARLVTESLDIEEDKLDPRYSPYKVKHYGRYSPIVAIAIVIKIATNHYIQELQQGD